MSNPDHYDDDVRSRDEGSQGNMDDIVKALTDFSVDGQASTDDLEENADIIKALTDLSAVSDTDITATLDNDPSLATSADQNNVVTISYTQVN